jgi:hypothetical protein
MSLPFTYAIVDDDGEVVRKHRWTPKEAKWHKDQGKNIIKLEVIKDTRSAYDIAYELVGECLV